MNRISRVMVRAIDIAPRGDRQIIADPDDRQIIAHEVLIPVPNSPPIPPSVLNRQYFDQPEPERRQANPGRSAAHQCLPVLV